MGEKTNDSRAEEDGDESLRAQLITLVQQVPPTYLPALIQLVQALILGTVLLIAGVIFAALADWTPDGLRWRVKRLVIPKGFLPPTRHELLDLATPRRTIVAGMDRRVPDATGAATGPIPLGFLFTPFALVFLPQFLGRQFDFLTMVMRPLQALIRSIVLAGM